MTFDLGEARQAAQETYPPLTVVDGDDVYTMPHARLLDPSIVAALEGRREFSQLDEVMTRIAPELWPKLKAGGLGIIEQFFDEWGEHSGLGDIDISSEDPGKGPRPRRSQSSGQNRAAKRSKPTSRSGASTSTRSSSGQSKAASASS